MTKPANTDWYERRNELEGGMVFRDYEGDLVMLDRRVPGDATQWYVARMCGGAWSYEDSIIEPGDLRERVDNASSIRRVAFSA